jgi:hypothetical protein
LHGFADTSSVEAFLDELAAHDPPRVVRLSRTPGERESRWMHLLCGEVALTEAPRGAAFDDSGASAASADLDLLKAEHKHLADEVARLQALVEYMAGERFLTRIVRAVARRRTRGGRCLAARPHPLRSITTSRYSLGSTSVPSPERLRLAIRASSSLVKAACLSASSAPKVLFIGP